MYYSFNTLLSYKDTCKTMKKKNKNYKKNR